MTRDGTKRAISFAIFGLGILGGLWGCLAYAGAMFVVGTNDSPQEVWALTFAFATPLPACVLALWNRLVAGIWLIFAGCYFVYGMLVQRTYMIQVRHFPDQPTVIQTVLGSLRISLVLIAIGTFAVITDRIKWPELCRWPRLRNKRESVIDRAEP